MLLSRLTLLASLGVAFSFVACAAGSSGDDDDATSTGTTTGVGTPTGSGGAGTGTVTGTTSGTTTGVGGSTGGAGGATGGTGGATGGMAGTGGAAGGGGGATGGAGGASGGAGGSGGGTVITTCTEWSFGALGNIGDHTSDIDVQWLEYRFVGDVMHLRVRHAPFNPATTTSTTHVQLWDSGSNALDLYWDGTANYTYTTDGSTWFDLPADPDLGVDTSLAVAAGVVVYTVPVDIVESYLSAASVPSEVFGGAYAYIPGSGFTDTLFPYPDTVTNINWTTRDQCYWPLASTSDPEGDTFDLVDYGAISYNAESGRFRARIDFFQDVTLGTQEAQAYLWDQSIVSGEAAIIYGVYGGGLSLGVRTAAGSWVSPFPAPPGGCATYPADLTASTRMLLIDCPQSGIESVVAANGGEFVFNSGHSYRMGGVTFSSLTSPNPDDLFPDGWTVYTDLDPIVIP